MQDVKLEPQRKETKTIFKSYIAMGTLPPKRVPFTLDLISIGDLSNCVHKGGELEHDNSQSDVLCGAPR